MERAELGAPDRQHSPAQLTVQRPHVRGDGRPRIELQQLCMREGRQLVERSRRRFALRDLVVPFLRDLLALHGCPPAWLSVTADEQIKDGCLARGIAE